MKAWGWLAPLVCQGWFACLGMQMSVIHAQHTLRGGIRGKEQVWGTPDDIYAGKIYYQMEKHRRAWGPIPLT